MKLSNVINVWDVLHTKDTGELGFEDLVAALSEIVGVQNDLSIAQCTRCPKCGTQR